MKKILFVVSLNKFDLESFQYAKKYLELKKFKVILSSKIEEKEFNEITKENLDINLIKEEINIDGFSAVILISETSSSQNYLNDATINDILLDCARKNIFSCSIYKETQKEIKEQIDSFLEII